MRPPGVLDLAPGIVLGYLPWAIVTLVVLGTALLTFRSRRMARATAIRVTALDLAVVTWLALTLLVTVVPIGQPRPAEPVAFVPFVDAVDRMTRGLTTPSDEASDIVLNLLLFTPFGLWPALRLHRSWLVATIVVGAVLSIGIEVTQAIEGVGRSASTTDVVTNTTGTAIGFLVGRWIRRGRDLRGP